MIHVVLQLREPERLIEPAPFLLPGGQRRSSPRRPRSHRALEITEVSSCRFRFSLPDDMLFSTVGLGVAPLERWVAEKKVSIDLAPSGVAGDVVLLVEGATRSLVVASETERPPRLPP